jgi:hypothetical protein
MSGVNVDRVAKTSPPTNEIRNTCWDGQAIEPGYERRKVKNVVGAKLALANANFNAYSLGVQCTSAIPIVQTPERSVNAENQRLTALRGLARRTKTVSATRTAAIVNRPMCAMLAPTHL